MDSRFLKHASGQCARAVVLAASVLLPGMAPCAVGPSPSSNPPQQETPQKPPPSEAAPQNSQPEPPAGSTAATNGGQDAGKAPKQPPAAEPGDKDSGKDSPPASEPQRPGPPLTVTGIAALEILPRDYEASQRFYVEVLGFREQHAQGGEGERSCTLVSGPARIILREQPGKVIQPKRHAWLGVYPKLLSEITAQTAGMKKPTGVLVDDLVPQGPASVAGLVRGDIILAIEGKEVTSPENLTATVRGLAPGKKALVTIWRDGKKQDIPVDLIPSPWPEQFRGVAIRLQVRDLDHYYREALRRNLRLYAEPRNTPSGARVLELVDPDDLLVVLEETPAADQGQPDRPRRDSSGESPAPEPPPPAPSGEGAAGEAPATAKPGPSN